MAFSRSTTLLGTFALLTSLASAATVQILALQAFGEPDPFMFMPNDVTAEVGDIIEFHFGGPGNGILGGNHSVAQGVWGDPCTPKDGGFWSGFMAVNETSTENDFVFRVEVNDTNPIVFYCAQAVHCTRGMHGVVNGNGDETLKSYRDSINVNFEATVPSVVNGTGGQFVPNTIENILPAEDPNAAGSLKVSMASAVAAGVFGLALSL